MRGLSRSRSSHGSKLPLSKANEFEIHTNEKVDFRFGRSVGKGRGLVATLLPSQAGSGHGPNIGGVDTIRLEREVEL